jgi:hypothetical protein
MARSGDRAVLPPPAPISPDPRARLAAEWQAAAPRTEADIAEFYRTAQHYGPDLEAWHQTPERQELTRMLVHVAKEASVKCVVDIGCGKGHDIQALYGALDTPELHGVEPNRALYQRYLDHAYFYDTVTDAPVESADLLICIDVLEHIPNPESYLAGIAQRAPVGCLLFEASACEDTSTPLHLPANRGWRTGHCLEQHGWELADETGRVHVWRRMANENRQRASLLLCAYRNVSVASLQAVMRLTAGEQPGWRLRVKTGDALISRSRSILLTAWWRETADDVCLLVDDDIGFTPADADHIVELCRNGYDIVAGAYPVHDGGHLALRYLDGQQTVRFGPDEPPMEIRYGATGFLAIHRRVVDALIATMPLCHPLESWSFYPLFPLLVIEDATAQGNVLLSEDWALCELARQAGFRVWLDPTIRLQHASTVPLSISNMAGMHDAISKA